MNLAIIETGGKQYIVSEGKKIKIEKIDGVDVGSKIKLDKVLLVKDGDKDVIFGEPVIDGAFVEGEVIRAERTKKMIVFRYHNKTRYRKKNTHRQFFVEVRINKIETPSSAK